MTVNALKKGQDETYGVGTFNLSLYHIVTILLLAKSTLITNDRRNVRSILLLWGSKRFTLSTVKSY